MIVATEDLDKVREEHADNKLVLTSGSFDLLHVGHLNYLSKVKTHGDVLVVLLSGDNRVRSRKGSLRPIIPEEDRAQMLDALKPVDYVIIDPNKNGLRQLNDFYITLISKLQPDIYITDGKDARFSGLLADSKIIIETRAAAGKHDSTSAIIKHIKNT